ncbi:MAG: hypothetical protein COV44_02460 [Deltaproteobacteria bacterium CG11_big_fil_rev_8_21_14_0_20_45_16]|nr:MAG: hypothetical protein COV44_02460 [Deltaproteobacteria bacterium CG11_big_fil_rev_8_21_14_0_20_45_16]
MQIPFNRFCLNLFGRNKARMPSRQRNPATPVLFVYHFSGWGRNGTLIGRLSLIERFHSEEG